MFRFIERYLKKSRSERILKLAEKLINECELDFTTEDKNVCHVNIWFDYFHHSTREIVIKIENVEYRIDTKKPNKNFKK